MIRSKTMVAASLLILLTGAGAAQQPTNATPAASTLTPMQLADALLRQMTIEEKGMQLSSSSLALFDSHGTNHSQLDALLKNRHRACFRARPDRAQDA